MLRASSAAVAILSLGLVSCAADAVSSPSSPIEVMSPSPTEATPSERASPSSPATAAPPELAGRWRRAVSGQTVTLTLQGTGYSLQIGPELAAGSIAVEGDQIEFFGSSRCVGAGSGFYTWGIEEDGRLRLTLIGEDACDRDTYLRRGTWRRLDS